MICSLLFRAIAERGFASRSFKGCVSKLLCFRAGRVDKYILTHRSKESLWHEASLVCQSIDKSPSNHERYLCNQPVYSYLSSLAQISSAAFLPLINMPPKIGPMRKLPLTPLAAMPETNSPG